MKKSLADKLNAMGVSRETQARLEAFVAVFQKWSASINLVAPSTIGEFWERHILDSLQVVKLQPDPCTWVDLGSGGGFPGIITAICLAEGGDGWIHLIESNNKKAAFLRAALSETGGRGSVHARRIEAVLDDVPSCDCVSARALAELDILLGYISPWAETNSQLRAFLHKGRDYQSELEVSRRRWDFDLVKHNSIVEPDSVILEISGLTSKS